MVVSVFFGNLLEFLWDVEKPFIVIIKTNGIVEFLLFLTHETIQISDV